LQLNQDTNLRADPATFVQILSKNNIVKTFYVGWSVLFQEVSFDSAKALSAMLAGATIHNTWIKKQVENATITLKASIARGTPWEVREKLNILESIFDSPTVDVIKQLLNEYPSFTRFVLGDKTPSTWSEGVFISTRSEIKQIHRFLKGLKI
jgi:hypothetical protein